jgi:chemotaxis protein MotB
VVKFLTERVGVDPKLMMAAAYSMNRPVASNDTKDGRAQNRRIEIALIPMNIDRVLKDLQ